MPWRRKPADGYRRIKYPHTGLHTVPPGQIPWLSAPAQCLFPFSGGQSQGKGNVRALPVFLQAGKG